MMIEKLISYFQKDVNVRIDYLHTEDGKIPDTFNIYITHKKKCHMLTNLEWDEIDRVIEVLEEENKPIQLWRQFGMGREILNVPKWARLRLAQKLREARNNEEKRIQKESKPISFAYDMLKTSKEKSTFFGNSMLISGVPGSGKTYAMKEILSELVKEGHRVAIVDFRNEYEDVVDKYRGVSLTSDEVHRIEGNLVRIHFGGDVFYDQANYDTDFLNHIVEEFDYLLIDDAQLLCKDYFHLGSSSNLYEVCASLIKKNLNFKIILSTQSLSSLSKEDRDSLQVLFGHHLLFRQMSTIEMNDCPKLRILEVGEALFCTNKKAKWLISFKTKEDGTP